MFTFEQMLKPIWDTSIVYGESFTMHRDENGGMSARFLYEPEEILEVTSANRECLYSEGRDFIIDGDRLVLAENTRIPFMEYEEVYMKEPLPGRCFPYPGGYSLFNEGHFFHDRQIAVTYRCKRGAWNGYVPTYCGDILHRTVRKLTEEKYLKVVLFGDSISAGANASGMTLATPFQPSFGDLFAENLRRTFDADVDFLNPSVGGKDSVWGMETLDERVIAHSPDLVILAFGMNGNYTPDLFESHIRNMVDRIKAANCGTEIILIATSTPNPILTDPRAPFWSYQYLYGEALQKLEGDGIALLDMGALQKELHKNKRFIDTTGNHVNHPNDFFIRIHAQALSAMLIK